MFKCNYCSLSFENVKIKANHIRWHHKDNTKGNKNISESLILMYEEKYGKLKEFIVICHKCKKPITVLEKEKTFPNKEKYYCSRVCSNSRKFTKKSNNKRSISNSIAGKKLWQNDEYSKKMLLKCKNFTSKGETEIRDYFINNFKESEWTFGRLFENINCDLYSRKLKVVIEYDGIWHFKNICGQLKDKKEKDKRLEEWCIKNGWKLIRLKEDIYFSDKKMWLDKLIDEAYNKEIKIIKFY